ncbi:MAG: cbb3-type cytochrome c oxidase subunit 3 [Candidatus Eisenbacteria bacterium]|nr:cbb3-type cytochrome c oxidase subunit 3 [Candidatus Eisenbacteria bacterium]
MSLVDVMSHAGLAVYAEVAMALFMIAFLVIVVWVFAPSRRREMDEAKRLPLEDEPAAALRPGAKP